MFERAIDRDVASAAGESDDHLDLVMQVVCSDRISDLAALRYDRVGRLAEKYRLRTIDGCAHFPRVFRVVAADAVDAVHRETQVAAGYGQTCDRRCEIGRAHV